MVFLGYAKVKLDDFVFDEPKHRKEFTRNVDRLERIFQTEGCNRHVADNFVHAELLNVNENIADTVFADIPSNWSHVSSLALPVKALSGLHRIRAANAFLPFHDRWWIAKIHGDLSQGQRDQISEEFRNERSHTDGEIFHKIMSYSRDGNTEDEAKWWARLTPSKSKDLKQLLRDLRYADAFHKLLPWPCLWTPLQLGTLHRLLTMKCDEEILTALHHVRSTWILIWQGIDQDLSLIDSGSISILECLAPLHSIEDAKTVTDSMDNSLLFPDLCSVHHREMAKRNILSIDYMIPTLRSIFEDLKYLEPASKVVRSLLDERPSTSTLESFRECYSERGLQIEYAENNLRTVSASQHLKFALAYQQLWLYALRNYTQMTNMSARKTPTMHKPCMTEPSPDLFRAVASLAVNNGFCSKAMEQLANEDTDSLLVRQILAQSGRVFHDATSLEHRLIAVLRGTSTVHSDIVKPSFFAGHRLGVLQRCGRPFQDDHLADQPSMFLQHMYEAPRTRGHHVSSFYRKWCMFRTFFGITSVCQQSISSSSDLITASTASSIQMDYSFSTSQQAQYDSHGHISSLEAKAQRLEATIVDLETRYGQQTDELSNATTQLVHCRAEMLQVQESMSADQASFHEQFNTMQAKLVDAESRKQHLENLIRERETETHRDQEGMTAGHVRERDALQEQIVRLQQQVDDRQIVYRLVSSTQQKNYELQNEADSLRQETTRLREEGEQEESRLQDEIDSLRQEIARLRAEGGEEKSRLQAEIDSLRRETARQEDTEQERSRLQDEIDGLRQKTDRLREETDVLRQRNDDLRLAYSIPDVLSKLPSQQEVARPTDKVHSLRVIWRLNEQAILLETLWPPTMIDLVLDAVFETPSINVAIGTDARKVTNDNLDKEALKKSWAEHAMMWVWSKSDSQLQAQYVHYHKIAMMAQYVKYHNTGMMAQIQTSRKRRCP